MCSRKAVKVVATNILLLWYFCSLECFKLGCTVSQSHLGVCVLALVNGYIPHMALFLDQDIRLCT